MAVAIHQQMLYWQRALQGCELQPATKQVNIFRPREPSNIRLWSSDPSQLGAPARHHRFPSTRAELSSVRLALSFFLRPAASGLRLSPWQLPARRWFARGALQASAQVLLLRGRGCLTHPGRYTAICLSGNLA